jgi:hypothetical protein
VRKFSRVRNLVDKTFENKLGNRPQYAIIHTVDMHSADIQIGNSRSITRNVEVIGDPTALDTGQRVFIEWRNVPGKSGVFPVVLAGTSNNSSGDIIYAGTLYPDDETIELTSEGIAVKPGSIGLEHLSFVPSIDGHSHRSLLGGWQVLADGSFYNNGIQLHPLGYINVGMNSETVRLSAIDATYRIWAGAYAAEDAPFSVDKDGAIYATSGEIAGWELTETGFSSDDGSAKIVPGDYPQITLGAATAFDTGIGIWLGKDDDDTYKFRIGDPDNDNMYWDGSDLIITGKFIGGSDIGYTEATTFTINNDANDVTVNLVLSRSTGGDLTLAYNGSYLAINKDFIPSTRDSADLGEETLRWRQVHASEIRAQKFVESNVSVLGGTFIIPKESGKLTAAVASGDTTLSLDFNPVVGDFLLIMAEDTGGTTKTEYMEVTALGPVTVTRDLAGAHGTDPAWPSGTIVMDIGQEDDGYVYLSGGSIPKVSVYSQGATYNAITETVRLGNLNGWGGFSSDDYGWAVGNYSGNKYAYYESTAGLVVRGEIKADSGYLGALDISGVLSIGTSGGIYQGSGTFASPTTGLKIWNDSGAGRIGGYSSSALQWYADTDGRLYAGAGSVILDSDGISIEAGEFRKNSIDFLDTSGNVILELGEWGLRSTDTGYWDADFSISSSDANDFSQIYLSTTSINMAIGSGAGSAVDFSWQYYAGDMGYMLMDLQSTGDLWLRQTTPEIKFGASGDVNIYRASSGMLKTDDDFTIGGGDLYLGTDCKIYRGDANIIQFADSVRGNISGGALKIDTGSGYVIIGPQNTSWCHMDTDRTGFYFYDLVYVNSDVRVGDGLCVGGNDNVGWGMGRFKGGIELNMRADLGTPPSDYLRMWATSTRGFPKFKRSDGNMGYAYQRKVTVDCDQFRTMSGAGSLSTYVFKSIEFPNSGSPEGRAYFSAPEAWMNETVTLDLYWRPWTTASGNVKWYVRIYRVWDWKQWFEWSTTGTIIDGTTGNNSKVARGTTTVTFPNGDDTNLFGVSVIRDATSGSDTFSGSVSFLGLVMYPPD